MVIPFHNYVLLFSLLCILIILTVYCSYFQALMAVGEVFPAVQAAEYAVKLDPTWWEARQTLGRALLNMGEVNLVSTSE